MSRYFAHSTSRRDRADWQPLRAHLRNVTALCLWTVLPLLAGCASSDQVRRTSDEPRLTFSEIDALRHQIGSCWTLPVGVEGVDNIVVQLHALLRRDGTIQSVTIEDQARLGRDPTFRAVA